MSTFTKLTRIKTDTEYQRCVWHDDWFGNHNYGVEFPSGIIVDPRKIELETKDEPNRTDWEDSEATVIAEYPNIQVIVDKHYDEALQEIFKVYDTELHELSIKIKTVDGLFVEKSYRKNQEILEAQNE